MAERSGLTHYELAQKKRVRFSALLILLVIPLLLGLSVLLLHNQWYMPLSLLILAAVMAPFFMIFEKRKPKAREVVLIAVLSAITVVLHCFFHIVLPIQIGTALVILFGVSLGPEAGFLIGALARFVCNFYMGQGVWTPWQMFCWGLLGFLAGLAFNRQATEELHSHKLRLLMGPVLAVLFAEGLAYLSFLIYPGSDESPLSWRLYLFGALGLLLGVLLQRKRLPVDSLTLCLFTFATVFVVYGGIMNFAALVTGANMGEESAMSSDALRLLFVSGVPYDLFHAATATLCVFLFGDGMIQKIERVKIKYGIYK